MSKLEWSIGLRYALVGRGDRFVSFSSVASAVGVALGVAAIIVVISVMNGFHVNLRDRILAASSHVEIHGLAQLTEAPSWQALVKHVVADERVVAAAPIVDRQGLLAAGKNVRGALFKGIVPEIEKKVTDLDSEPGIEVLIPGSFKVLLGTVMAARLGVTAGDKLVLLAPNGIQTLGGMLPRFKTVKVAGTVDFGVHNLNDGVALMHMEDAAKVFRVSGADSIRIRLIDVQEAPAVAADLRTELGLAAFDWTTSNATLFNALAVERRVMFVILSLIVAVAAFQIVAALVTMVRSKRGAIAILRTIGMSPAALMRIFLIQGMLIGAVGTLTGVAAGLALAVNVNLIVTSIESLFGFDFFPGEVYFLESIPSKILPLDVLATAAMAFGLTLLATILPSLTAARLNPADALRHE